MAGKEWQCKHGVGHPYAKNHPDNVHGCDGRCGAAKGSDIGVAGNLTGSKREEVQTVQPRISPSNSEPAKVSSHQTPKPDEIKCLGSIGKNINKPARPLMERRNKKDNFVWIDATPETITMMWEEYAQAPDEKLTFDAKMVKDFLLGIAKKQQPFRSEVFISWLDQIGKNATFASQVGVGTIARKYHDTHQPQPDSSKRLCKTGITIMEKARAAIREMEGLK